MRTKLSLHPVTIQGLITLGVVAGFFADKMIYAILFVLCFFIAWIKVSKKALKILGIASLLLLFSLLLRELTLWMPGQMKMFSNSMNILLGMIFKIYPIFFLVGLLSSYSSSKQLSAYRSVGISWRISLTMALIYRFLPDFKMRRKEIKEGMALRGLAIHPLRPMRSIELMVVPMIAKAISLSDSISAALYVKGAQYPCKKTIYRKMVFSFYDGFVLLLFILLLGVSLWKI